MFGRKVKTRLDLLKNFAGRSEDQENYFKRKRGATFEEGEIFYVRDYRNPNKRAWKKSFVCIIYFVKNELCFYVTYYGCIAIVKFVLFYSLNIITRARK